MKDVEVIGKDSSVKIEVVVHCERCGVAEHYPKTEHAARSAHIEEHPQYTRIEYTTDHRNRMVD